MKKLKLPRGVAIIAAATLLLMAVPIKGYCDEYTYTVYLYNSNDWTNGFSSTPYIYIYDSSNTAITSTFPGNQMTKYTDSGGSTVYVYSWKCTASSVNIIFNLGSSTTQTSGDSGSVATLTGTSGSTVSRVYYWSGTSGQSVNSTASGNSANGYDANATEITLQSGTITTVDLTGSSTDTSNSEDEGSTSSEDDSSNSTTYTFYVKYTGSTSVISSPYLHIWDSSNETTNTTTWPGLSMELYGYDSDGYMVYVLTTSLSYTPTTCIFDNGGSNSGNQSGNITLTSGFTTYYITVSSLDNSTTVTAETSSFLDGVTEIEDEGDMLDNLYFIIPNSDFSQPCSANKFAYQRERNGGSYLADYQSYNIQSFVLKQLAGESATSVTFQIMKDPFSGTESDTWLSYGSSATTVAGSSLDSNIAGTAYGNAAASFGNATINANLTVSESSSSSDDNTKFTIEFEDNVMSYTLIYNNGALFVLKNYRNFGGSYNGGNGSKYSTSDSNDALVSSDGYYLVGNFQDADATVNIDPRASDSRYEMTKLWWKDGTSSTTALESYDSLTYVTAVPAPAKGFGEMYCVVFDKTDITNLSSYSDTELWKYAIRPQASPYDVNSDDAGYDQTATHGGLWTRSYTVTSDDIDHQQALNPAVGDDVVEFMFSMNITTSTYRIYLVEENEDHGFYIMGPAVGSWDESTTDYSSAWNDSDDNTHALKMTYDGDEKCYMYVDDSGTEQQIYLNAGQPFCFVYDRDFSQPLYMEDDVTPVDMSGTDTSDWTYATRSTSTNNEEKNVYGLAGNDNANNNHDTQYVNFLRHADGTGSSTYNSSTVDAITFNLPSGYYNIRLYIKSVGDVAKYYYIISPRTYSFTVPNAYDGTKLSYVDDNGGSIACDAYKAFSDYHAVVLPDNVHAWYPSSAATQYSDKSVQKLEDEGNMSSSGYIEMTELTWTGGDRIVPANMPVILGYKSDHTDYTSTTLYTDEVTIPYCSSPWINADSLGMSEIYAADTANYKPQIARRNLPQFSVATTDNVNDTTFYYMFGYYTYSDDSGNADSKASWSFVQIKNNTSATAINSCYLTASYGDTESTSDSDKQTIRLVDMLFGNDIDDGSSSGGSTTDINNAAGDTSTGDDYYYNMQGMRLSQRPSAKGIYIHNGKKIIIR